MEMAIKLSLFASIIFAGYNISQLVISFESIKKKVQDFKQIALENETRDFQIRLSNLLLTCVFAIVYMVILFLAGFEYWFLGIVFFKMFITGALSNAELGQILNSNSISRKIFMMDKVDSVFNILLGFAISLILVV